MLTKAEVFGPWLDMYAPAALKTREVRGMLNAHYPEGFINTVAAFGHNMVDGQDDLDAALANAEEYHPTLPAWAWRVLAQLATARLLHGDAKERVQAGVRLLACDSEIIEQMRAQEKNRVLIPDTLPVMHGIFQIISQNEK